MAIYTQLNYILDKETGIEKDGIVIIESPLRKTSNADSRLSFFIKEVRQIKGVYDLASSYSVIGDPDTKGFSIQRNKNSNYVGVDSNGGVDEGFLTTYKIKLLAGRNFLADHPSDQNSILISRASVARLGISSLEQAVGKKIILAEQGKGSVEIIGVFEDYEFRPFFNDVAERRRGVALTYRQFLVPEFKPLKLSIALNMNYFKREMEEIQKLYKTIFPEEPVKWYLLKEKTDREYNNEKIAKNQITFFTILAIGIACLGLLGLISNKAIEKTKEIGIRKVLGAQLYQIAQILLSTTFIQVTVAALIGIPLAYYLVQKYLEVFSERVELQWWHYVMPVAILMVLMFGTIVSVLIKSSRTNPVDSLRYE